MRRGLALAIACSLGVASPSAAAFGPAPPLKGEPEDALAAAKTHHADADAKYNTADYDGAIESWQKAFAALPRTPEANTYRSLILYNIASAHEKLYSLRGDVEQLKRARILLVQFEASIDEVYAGAPEEGESERKQVQAKIAGIDALIAEANEKTEPAAATPTRAADEPAAANPKATDAPPRKRQDGAGLLVTGGVMLGIGAIALGGMTGALVVSSQANDISDIGDSELQKREDQFERGRRANVAGTVTGIVAAVLVSTGVALVVLGVQRRTRTTAFAPAFGRGMAGLTVHGRF